MALGTLREGKVLCSPKTCGHSPKKALKVTFIHLHIPSSHLQTLPTYLNLPPQRSTGASKTSTNDQNGRQRVADIVHCRSFTFVVRSRPSRPPGFCLSVNSLAVDRGPFTQPPNFYLQHNHCFTCNTGPSSDRAFIQLVLRGNSTPSKSWVDDLQHAFDLRILLLRIYFAHRSLQGSL